MVKRIQKQIEIDEDEGIKLYTKRAQTRENNSSKKTISRVKKMIQRSNGRECPGNEAVMRVMKARKAS